MEKELVDERGILLRWATLMMLIINVLFNYFYQQLFPESRNIAEITREYDSLFIPAGYAFSIWGLIYVLFFTYCIWQLRAAQQTKAALTRISAPLLLVNFLSAAWVVAYSFGNIGFSLAILLTMLAVGTILFIRANELLVPPHYKRVVAVPFSIFFGWLCVAAISNVAIWLVSLGWKPESTIAILFAMLLLVFTVFIGLFIGFKFRNGVFPLAIAWACLAIWYKNQTTNALIASSAMVITIVLVTASVSIFIKLYSVNKQVPRLS